MGDLQDNGDGMSEKPCMECPHPNTAHDREHGTCLAADCPCVKWSEAMLSFQISDSDDMGCSGCGRALSPGLPYARRPYAVDENGMTWLLITCVYCDLDDVARAERERQAAS